MPSQATAMPLSDEQMLKLAAQSMFDVFARTAMGLMAVERQQLTAQRRPKYSIASFIGASAAAVEVKRQARRAAQTDCTVLLLGEPGTGRELLAHGIHAASARAGKPFVGVNIAAVPESLLEAEFVGVAPGAYTGAERKGRDGKFRCANGGTLLIDELGDMPLALQSKLRRVLQEQEREPLGSNQVQRIDVRVIAVTSRDLPAMVAAGSFRADLYYRLNVLPIRLPALRERIDDLEALVDALVEDISRRSGRPHKSLNADALDLLARHAWPGNIRELRKVLERATLMTDDLSLGAAHFGALAASVAGISAALPPRALQPVAEAGVGLKPLPQPVAELEMQSIRQALGPTGGNKLAAARRLGISRATLYQKLPRAEAAHGATDRSADDHPALPKAAAARAQRPPGD
jgi:transcriptional regulator with PAS, ATPase and Fis domain